MSRETFIGLLFVLLSLTGMTYLLAGDSHFPLLQWPYQAFQGLVFSLVWGFGVSTTVGYVYGVLITVTVAVISFALGHKLSRTIR